jgi:hypothetical protein
MGGQEDGDPPARVPIPRPKFHAAFLSTVMQERGERYRERMAGVSERVIGHVETMDADEILSQSAQVERIDTVARRTFGLDNTEKGTGALNLNVLTGGRAIVQIAKAQS